MATYQRRKKKDSTPVIIAVVAAAVVGGFIYLNSKKSTSTDQVMPVTNAVIPAVTASVGVVSTPQPSSLAAPQVFSDQDRQQQFNSLFNTIIPAFEPPKPGTPVRIDKINGGRVEGEMLRFTPNGVVLTATDGLITINRDDMDDATRRRLFAEDFGRALAAEKVESGIEGQPPTSLNDALLRPKSTTVMEVRRFSASTMTARYGPGRHYAEVPGAELFKGQQVHVIAETNAWICVKSSAASTEVVGWFPKFVTFTQKPEDKASISKEVQNLIDTGFVVEVTPAKNEVLVDMYEWRISDPDALEGKCRLLAYYCGQQRNSRLFWVDIRDALSNKRVAEYSESKGFKIY